MYNIYSVILTKFLLFKAFLFNMRLLINGYREKGTNEKHVPSKRSH